MSTRVRTPGFLSRTRVLALTLFLVVAAQPAHGGTLASVTPMGASPTVAVSITGTGFNATAANNVVTFTPAAGSAATATATAVATLSAATGLRRLTVTVPAGLPVGTAALRVRNTATGETSAGKSLEIVEIYLPGVTSAAVGASNVNVRITGSPNSAFAAGSTRATFGAGVTVNSTTVESPTSLVANVSVASSAAPGLRGVGVLSNTQTALRAQAFAVVAVTANRPPVWSLLQGPTLNEGASLELRLTASDPDGDPVRLTVAGLPPFAAFVDAGNGTATLTLNPGFGNAGVYTLIATATDSKGAATSFSLPVIVLAVNRPPTANAQQLTVAEDQAVALTLTGNDPDGDPVTFSISGSPGQGTLTGLSPALIYTPAADYFGPDELEFVANDGSSNSQPVKVAFNVTEVNDAPRLGADTALLKYVGTLPGIPPPPVCRTPCGVIYGDPHVLTYDHGDFDVQAVGEVIATKSTTDDFEVQARFAPVPGYRTVSIAIGVAMRVVGHRVTLFRTPVGYQARIDGALATLSDAPQLLPGGGTIGKYGTDDSVFVTWPDGTLVIARAVGIYPEYYRFVVEVGLPPSRLDRVVGILADGDGILTNDIVTRGGVELTYPDPPFATFYGTYVNSWRVSMAESLFDYGPGQSTDTFTDLSYPDQEVTPQNLPAAALSRATAVCDQFGLGPAFRDACLVDVGVTGDADFATEAAAAQASALGLPNNAGSSEIDEPTTVTIDTPGSTAVRTFSGTAGQRVTLTVTGNSIAGVDLRVRDPSGGTVTNLFTAAATGFREVFTLPATGTYTITIDPRDLLVGTLTFELSDVPDNDGTTQIGTPTPVTLTTTGEVAVRAFTAAAGQKLTMSVIGNTMLEGVDLRVTDPSGGTVTNLFTATATGFRDTFTLPVTGTYTVNVDPRDPQVGTLTFTLNAVPDNTGTTAIGTPTTVTIATIGENAVRTFTATAGQLITLSAAGNTIPGMDLTVLQPNGGTIASLFVSGPTGFRDTFALPVAGTYSITINPRDQLVGTVTFTLSAVPQNTGTTAIGTPTTVTLGTIGENAVRTFTATAGQLVTLSAAGNTVPGMDLAVLQPNGGTIASLFVSGPTGFRDTFALPVAGTYSITINPRDQLVGTVTFTLNAVPQNTGTTAIGAPTTVTIATVGENAVRTFAGAAGQSVSISVTGNTIAGADIIVRQPNDGVVATLFVSGATAVRAPFSLPVTGNYTITVDPRAELVGVLTFTLNAVAPP